MQELSRLSLLSKYTQVSVGSPATVYSEWANVSMHQLIYMCDLLRQPRQTREVGETGGVISESGVCYGIWNGICNQLHEHSCVSWQGLMCYTIQSAYYLFPTLPAPLSLSFFTVINHPRQLLQMLGVSIQADPALTCQCLFK